jgi:hypothetical protein
MPMGKNKSLAPVVWAQSFCPRPLLKNCLQMAVKSGRLSASTLALCANLTNSGHCYAFKIYFRRNRSQNGELLITLLFNSKKVIITLVFKTIAIFAEKGSKAPKIVIIILSPWAHGKTVKN